MMKVIPKSIKTKDTSCLNRSGLKENQSRHHGCAAFVIGHVSDPSWYSTPPVEIITMHGQEVQSFIDDQQGQIIIITVVVEGATGQNLRSKFQLAFHSRSFRRWGHG
jgi:hypothetical protein